MVVQATMLSTVKPRGAETGVATANPAAPSGSPPAVQANPPQPQGVKPQGQAPAQDLQRTVSDAQDVAEAAGASLEFTIDKDSGKTIVKVVDASTSEIIRQIPSEELLTLARNMTKLEGLLLDQKA